MILVSIGLPNYEASVGICIIEVRWPCSYTEPVAEKTVHKAVGIRFLV